MADITSPEAIKFCDEKARVMADALSLAYFTAKSIIAEWHAGISSEIPNDSSPIRDGANPESGVADGRHPITGIDVNNIMNRASEFVTDMEANSNAKLNTVLAVRVNGQPLF